MVYESTEQKLSPFAANLKSDIQIFVREAVIQDAADFIRCVRNYIADSTYMVMEPNEFAPDTSQGREFIQNLIESENSLLIVATHNEKIIGNLDITGGRRRRLRHTGLVGMGIAKDYRDKGLGQILLETGIKWARKNPMLEKLWLQIIADNTPALNLYKKMGFIEEGRQKEFIKAGDGQYYDNLLMAYKVK
jgi:RimJ/RimL family protein N-acetyltransferase